MAKRTQIQQIGIYKHLIFDKYYAELIAQEFTQKWNENHGGLFSKFAESELKTKNRTVFGISQVSQVSELLTQTELKNITEKR